MATLPSTTVNPDGPQPVRVLRSEINAERARKLGERFKLTFDAEEWVTAAGPGKEEAWRIEKPIRMRVHRTCHKCSTTFGGNKICAGCQHNRCTKCPRYPVKKSKDREKEAASVVPVHGITIEVDNCWNLQDDIVLTMPSKRVGGQPLVRKKPVQRVRRTCHACSAMFPPGSKICTGCSHVRCTDCPRDPYVLPRRVVVPITNVSTEPKRRSILTAILAMCPRSPTTLTPATFVTSSSLPPRMARLRPSVPAAHT